MTPAPALTEAKIMTTSLNTEQIEHIRQYGYLNQEQLYALCDLAKLALSLPQDVAGLIEDLRGAEWICDDERLPFSKEVCRKAADALLSLSARIRGLEDFERRVAEIPLDDRNGSRRNFVDDGFRAADLVNEAQQRRASTGART